MAQQSFRGLENISRRIERTVQRTILCDRRNHTLDRRLNDILTKHMSLGHCFTDLFVVLTSEDILDELWQL